MVIKFSTSDGSPIRLFGSWNKSTLNFICILSFAISIYYFWVYFIPFIQFLVFGFISAALSGSISQWSWSVYDNHMTISRNLNKRMPAFREKYWILFRIGFYCYFRTVTYLNYIAGSHYQSHIKTKVTQSFVSPFLFLNRSDYSTQSIEKANGNSVRTDSIVQQLS